VEVRSLGPGSGLFAIMARRRKITSFWVLRFLYWAEHQANVLPRSEEILTLMPGPAVEDSGAGFSWQLVPTKPQNRYAGWSDWWCPLGLCSMYTEDRIPTGLGWWGLFIPKSKSHRMMPCVVLNILSVSVWLNVQEKPIEVRVTPLISLNYGWHEQC
jgi:hypothetical protein